MAIRPTEQIYRGTDYLPDYFHMLLDIPWNEGYAAVVNGIFRSFTIFTYVDEGKAVIRRAVRTHTEYEHKKLATKTCQWVLQHSAKTNRLQYHESIHEGFDRLSKHTVMKMEQRDFLVETTNLLERISGKKTNIHASVTEIGTKTLGEILENSNLCRCLFSNDRVIVDLVPYRIMRSNSLLMKTERTTVIASDLHRPKDATLAFGSYYHAHAGLNTPMDNQRVTIRRVRKEDFDKVIAIRRPAEIYFGRDYLPDYFNMLLDMPNSEGYAAVVDGIIRSFKIATFVDNGKSVIWRAGRTHKDYEKKGLNTKINQWFLENSTQAKELIYSLGVRGGSKQFSERTFMKLEYRDFKGTRASLLECLTTDHIGSSVDEIGTDKLEELFGNSNLCNSLFPNGRLMVDLVPYRIMRSNASVMKTFRSLILISDLNNLKDATITFGNYYHAPVGLCYNLDVYGAISQSFRDHVVLHLRKLLSLPQVDDVVISVYPMNNEWSYISSVLNEFGFEKTQLFRADCLTLNERKISDIQISKL